MQQNSAIRWKVDLDPGSCSVKIEPDFFVDSKRYPEGYIKEPPDYIKVQFIKECLRDLHVSSLAEVHKFLEDVSSLPF